MTLADAGKSGNKEQRWQDEDVDLTASATVGKDLVVEFKLTPDECQEELQFILFRGDLLMPSDRYEIHTRGNVVQLTLKESQKDDAGHYALVAKKLSTGLSIPGDEKLESRRKIRLSIQDSSQGFDEGEPPIFIRRLSDLAVKVGTRTRFLVEIRSSTSPKVTWHKNDEPVQSGSRFSFVHEGNFYCVDVAPVMVDDQGHWTCMAENGGGRSSCTSFLNVIVPKAYKKPEFVDELRAILTETGTVSLECKVVGVPTPVLKWFKDQKEIKAGDVFALTANPDDPTSLGTYTCEAVNCMGTACSSSRVHVVGKGSREGSLKPADTLTPSGPPPIFKRILRDESCKIGDSITLSCQVTVPPWPKSITWYNKEGTVEPSEKYHIIEDGLGGYSIEIKGVEAMDEGEWKCVATSSENMKQFSTCYVAMSIPKNYRLPRFMESLKAVLTDEGLVSFECKVVGFPTPLLRWFKDGQELHPGDVYQLTGTNSLGSYCCIAKNCMGEAKSTAELTVEDIQNQLNEEERLLLMSSNQAPKFAKGLRSCEARINDDFTFTIQVSVSPEPSLSWYRDDVPIIESEKYRLARETLGTCHLEIKKLEFVDQAEWKCVAANDFGHSVTSCFLKLVIPKHFKKPKFLESLRAILSEEGAVNLECKVIGVPQPVLKWYKDGVELKPGDIHRIISGQDGTCCLGTYTCEATNCMGSVSSSASLLGFEDRVSVRKEEAKEPVPLHELARNLSLSTIHEERTSQLYDTPQTDHSITLDDRGEISFSFDGKEVSVSLYETPDLTEEEALQIVEMYADQLSEHITEGNVIELPPMRFTKETSTTGNLLMEAVVIDVSPDYFVPDEEADDLRTEADVEDVSIMDDQMQSIRSLSYVSPPVAEFPGDRVPSGSPPSRPPRRKESKESASSRSEKSDKSLPKGFDWSESYHSAKEPSMHVQSSLQGQDDSAEAFTDALSSSGTSRSKAEEPKELFAAFVEQTIEKIPLDEINNEEIIETPAEEYLVQDVLVKGKKKKKGKQTTKGSRTPSISSKASSEESYSVEPEERVKRRPSKNGKEKGSRRGSTSSNKSTGKGRKSRSPSESGKIESAAFSGLQTRESDATIRVEDVRIVRTEKNGEMGATNMPEMVYVEDSKGIVEDRPASAASVASTIDSEKSLSKPNKERLLDNIYKLAEPIMTLRSALVDLDSLLPLLQTDGSPTDVERAQIEIVQRIVAPVESLCEQVSAIENKALKSAGDRSLAQNVRISLLEAVGGPTEELLRGIELLRRHSDQPPDPKAHLIVLESLTDPVDEILVGLTQIEHELTSRESFETSLVSLEKPIALERMCRAVSRLGTNIGNITERNLTFGDESTSCSVIERLQSVYQSLQAFLSTVPLSDVSGVLENNVDTLVVETLVRPLEELSNNLNTFSSTDIRQQSDRDSIVADLEKSMGEMRTRLEALTVALETYEKESGEQGITELHADLVNFLRYTMDDAVERLEKLKNKKKRVTQESRADETAVVTPKIFDGKSRQDSDEEELAMQNIVESLESGQSGVLRSLAQEAAAIMNIVAVPSIVEAKINETETQAWQEKSKTIEKSTTVDENEPPVKKDRKKKPKKLNSSEQNEEAFASPKTQARLPPELDPDLSLPEMLLDPLIDVQANLSDVISDFESQESAEESSLPGTSDLAACLTELRECVATAVHTATTLKSANTVNALIDLREPLLDLQLAMASASSPEEVKLIREATIPLTELKIIVAAAIESPQASEASQIQMKPVLRMLEDIEAEVTKVSQEEVTDSAAAAPSMMSEAKETRSIPKRPPEEVERAAVALTGVHFAFSTALDRVTSLAAEDMDSPSLPGQQANLTTARDIAEQSAASNLITSIEELRQCVGSLAVAIGTPVASVDNNDQYSYDILFDELAKLEEPLLNLQKVLLTEAHGPEDRHVLNDVASPIRSLKEVIQDVTREIGGGSTPIILELIEDVEKDVSLIAMEALKKALARKSIASDDDGVASVGSDFKPGEVPGIISKWLVPIENWLTSTAEEVGDIDKEQTPSSIASVVDDLKRELLKIAIQTSYSEPPSDIALIESLTELQEPLARVCEILAECHEPESLDIVEGLIQPTKHLLGTILDASMTHEAGKVLRPVLETIEELENQIPLTIKRATYERELQRVVKSMTPEEPETLMADDISETLDDAFDRMRITTSVEVHETSGGSSREIATAVNEFDAEVVESDQALSSEEYTAQQATKKMDESRDERIEAAEVTVEKDKSEGKMKSLTETDAVYRGTEEILEVKALPEYDAASVRAEVENEKMGDKPKGRLESGSEIAIALAQTLSSEDCTTFQAGDGSLENLQKKTQEKAQAVDVKVNKEKAKLSRQVATADSQLEETADENVRTFDQENPALAQAEVQSLERDDSTEHVKVSAVTVDKDKSNQSLEASSKVATTMSQSEVTAEEMTQSLSQEYCTSLQAEARTLQTGNSQDQAEAIRPTAEQGESEKESETSSQVVLAAAGLEETIEENVPGPSQENSALAHGKLNASKSKEAHGQAEAVTAERDQSNDRSENVRSDTIEVITVDGRPFAEDVTSLEPKKATKTATEEISRAEQLESWTLTLLGPLDRLGDAVLSLDRSLDDEAHVLLCRPLDSLHKQIESAVSQFNRLAGQAPENDVETIIEGFLSPVNQLHSALCSAVVVWDVEEPRPAVNSLLRDFADSSTELCELLDALRNELYPQIQRSAQSRQEQQEDASLAETITAVLVPLDNLRNLIETTLKSERFVDLAQKAMEHTASEGEGHVEVENMATAREICHEEERIQEGDDSAVQSLQQTAQSREQNELSKASVSQADTVAAAVKGEDEFEIPLEENADTTKRATVTEIIEPSVQEKATTSKPDVAKVSRRGSKGMEESMDIEENTAKPLEELIEAIVDSSGPRNVPSSTEGYQSITPDISDDNLDKIELSAIEESDVQTQNVEIVGLTETISTEDISGENVKVIQVHQQEGAKANFLIEGALAKAETTSGDEVSQDTQQRLAEIVSSHDLDVESVEEIGIAGQTKDNAEQYTVESHARAQQMEGVVTAEGAHRVVTDDLAKSKQAQVAETSQKITEIQAFNEAEAAELHVQEGNLVEAAFDNLQPEEATLVMEKSLAKAESEKQEGLVLGSSTTSHEIIPSEDAEAIVTKGLEKQNAESRDIERIEGVSVCSAPEIVSQARDAEVADSSELLEETVQSMPTERSQEQSAELREGENLAKVQFKDGPEMRVDATDDEITETQGILEESVQDLTAEEMQRKVQLREDDGLATASATDAPEIKIKPRDAEISEAPEFSETSEDISTAKLEAQRGELRESKNLVTADVTAAPDTQIKPNAAQISKVLEMPEESVEGLAANELNKQEAEIREEEKFATAEFAEGLTAKVGTIDAKVSETTELREEQVGECLPEISDKQTAEFREAVGFVQADITDAPDIKIRAIEAQGSTTMQYPEESVDEIVQIHVNEQESKIIDGDSLAKVDVTDAPETNIKAREAHLSEESTVLQKNIQEITKQESQTDEASASVTDNQTANIAKIKAAEVDKYRNEETIDVAESAIVEIIETPTQKIFKVRKEGSNSREPDTIVERVVVKPVEEVVAMEDQHIVEIVETPTEKVIKMKLAVEREDGVVEEVVKEIVVNKPIEGWTKMLVEEERQAISVSDERVQELVLGQGSPKDFTDLPESKQLQSAGEDSKDSSEKNADTGTDKAALTMEKQHDMLRKQEDEANAQIESQGTEYLREERVDDSEHQERKNQEAERLKRKESEYLKQEDDGLSRKTDHDKMEIDTRDLQESAEQDREGLDREERERSKHEAEERSEREREEIGKCEEAELLEREQAERIKREEAVRSERVEAERIEREKAECLEREEVERLEREEAERVKRKETERVEREEAERAKREEAERLEREEMERLEREEAERLKREEAERLEREEAERLKREEEKRIEQEEADRIKREETERLEREEAERVKREEAERLKREEAERLKREEEKRIEQEEADRIKREETERLEREEAERVKREEAERLEREEAERLKREEEKRIEREEADRMKREEAERLEREEAERVKRDEAERLEREEAERLKREEEKRLEREEADRIEREEAERLEREEAERVKRDEAERLEREEAERLKREEEKRLEREEADRIEREEAERLEQKEAERVKREEAKRLEEEEAERVKREEAERLEQEEAERLKRDEVERLEQEEAERVKREEAKRLEEEEAERVKREEAKRLEEEEAERVKREKAERLKQEEAERLKREEAERLQQEEAERVKREETKRLEREEAERLEREEANRLEREKTERLEREEAERLEREEAERLEREEVERLKLEELERKKKDREEILRKEEAEKLKEEERKRQEELEAERLKTEESERQEKVEAERLRKEEEERLRKEEAKRLEREERERQEKLEAERLEKEEQERLQKEEAEKLEKQERDRQEKAKQEAEQLEREELKRKEQEAERLKQEELERARKEEEKRQKEEEAERLKQEELERAKREEQERREKEEAERLKHEELERARREEEERLKKEEAERLEQEERERIEKEEDERIKREEAERLQQEELERIKKKEEKRIKKEEKERKIQEAEQLKQEELERAKKEEEERVRKDEAERLKKEEFERIKKEEEKLEEEKLKKEEAAKLEQEETARLEAENVKKEEAAKLEAEKLEEEREEVESSKKKERKRAEKKEVELLEKEEDASLEKESMQKLEKEEPKREAEKVDQKAKDVAEKSEKKEQEQPLKQAKQVDKDADPQPKEAEDERLKKKELKRQQKEESKRLKRDDSNEESKRSSKKSAKKEIVSSEAQDKAQAAAMTERRDSDEDKTPMNSEHEISDETNKHHVRVHEDMALDREPRSTSTVCTDSEIDSAYSESAKSATSRAGVAPSRRRRSGQDAAIEVDYDTSKERSERREKDRQVPTRTRDDTLSSDDRHYTGHYSATSRIHESGPGPRDRGKKPFFCTKLTDRTAAEASRIKLTCTILGEPEPQVYWTKDGVELPNSSNRHGITEDNGMVTLEFYAASPKDSGEYSCVAKNPHGQAHTEAKLKVYAGYEPAPAVPTFTRPIKDTYRSAENELVLECRVRGQPSPKITWLKDGQPLEMGDRYRQCDLGDGLCRLKISNPDFYDSGLYTCKAENASKNSDRTSHVVNFEGKGKEHSWRGSYRNLTSTDIDTGRPRFSSYLTDHSVPAGGTIALQVEVKGVPPPDITWMRGDKREPIPSYKARTFADSGIYTLIVPEATESETGTYVCRASNAYGYVDTTANVQVVSSNAIEGGKPAMFISRPAETMIHVTVGEDVSVSFRVNGVPKPRIVWMKGMRDISNGPRSYKESIDDYVRLTLKRALVSDEGTYCILAKNRYGCDRTFYTVKVKQRARSLTPSPDWGSVDTDNLLANIHDTERSYLKQVPGPIASEPVVVDGGRNWLALSWGKAVQNGPAPVVAYRVDAWLLGGEGGARWSELGITPVNAYDAFNLRPGGEYKFRITPRNRYGWGETVTMTNSVTVREIAKFPEFSKILTGQLKALRGETLHLECEVRSESKAEVKWYRDTTDIETIVDPRYMTYFNGWKSSLTVQSIKEHDSGRFVCEATNPAGRVSTFARVQVVTDPKIVEADEKLRRLRTLEPNNGERPPEFTMRLRDRRVQMTYPVRLTCQVSGHPEPEVTWYKNRDEIFQDENTSFWDDESHFHTLEISHSTLDDCGIYMAKARNVNGMVSCRCHLVVDKGIRAYVAPEFFRHLDAVYTVKSGGELRMSAQIEAYPTVGIVWHRDGHRLRPSRNAVMTLNHDGSVELSLAHVTSRDAGLYCCTATNEVGQTESTTRVTVLGAADDELPSLSQSLPDVVESPVVPYSKEPVFVTKPLSTEAVEGDTVIILCEVVGDPKPEVIWLRDFLRPDYYRDAAQFRRVGAGPQYRLEIPYAKLDFTGAYSVIAKNCHGEAKAIISLQIYARGQGKIDSSMEQATIKHGNVQTLPSIKRPLRDLRCCDGDAVTLICRVHATPEPDVRWEKGGKLVSLGEDFAADFDGETARLSIQHVYPEDEGEYTCVAYNDLGKAFTSACLIVDVPEGKESALSRTLARPIGLLSAESTPISTPRSTPIRSLSPSCVTSRRELKPGGRTSRGQMISRRPRLPTGPKFYAVPHNRVAEEGETVRFQCAVAGHPTPWVTWDKDGVTVTPTARISLKERDDVRILEIVEITHEDAGLYRITLENDVGRTEATARLEIIKGRHSSVTRSIRTRSASPRTYSIYSRSPITSAVRGDTHLRPNIYDPTGRRGGTVSPTPSRWHQRNGKPHVESPEPVRRIIKRNTPPAQTSLKNGVPTPPKPQNLKVPVPTKPRSSSVPKQNPSTKDVPVHLTNARQTKTSNARRATNEAKIRSKNNSTATKMTTTNGSLIPTRSPISRSRSPKISAKRSNGSPKKIENSVDSDESMTVIDDDTSLKAAEKSEAQKPEIDGISNEETSETKILTLVESPSTKSREMREELSENASEDAKEPRAPMILAAPADIVALRGAKVVLLATFESEPQPRVRWLRKGRDVKLDDKAEIETSRGLTCLTLEAVTTEQAGRYAITLENAAGRDCRYVNVTVEGVPDPPAGAPCVQSITRAGKAIVTWRSPPYDGGCAVTGYSVEMKRSEEPCWIAVAEARHSLSHTVTGLVSEETYRFRVRAENAHGVSEPGIVSEAVTVPGENDEEIGGQVFVAEINQIEIDEEDEEFAPAFEARIVSSEEGEKFEERYDVREELGKGRYGIVRRIVEKSTGLNLAAKFVRTIKSKDRQQVYEEIGIMNMLRHPKLLRLAAAFESPKEMIMVTEYISGGELFERVVADDFTLTEKDSIQFVKQICEGVEYMHANSVVHLDLKPENIMCHTRTSHRIKLIDFGLAQTLKPDTPVRVLLGTPEFIPPEIIGFEPIGTESDMWSVGVICYVLLTGLSPFMGDNDAETFANITRADYDFDDKAFAAISQEAKDFISALLVKRKELRMSAKQCLEHAWLAQRAESMSRVALPTDKLKKFIVRRKWQKTGNAIRALGRMATLSANSRRNMSADSSPTKTEFGDELFADVTASPHGFKPIQPTVIIEDRTGDDCSEKPEEIVDQQEKLNEPKRDEFVKTNEDLAETEITPTTEEIPIVKNYSNGFHMTENYATVTELETTEIPDEIKSNDSPPLIQEIDDLIKNKENEKSRNSVTEVTIEELPNEIYTETDVSTDLDVSVVNTSYSNETTRKLSFSSFVNLKIDETGMIEVSQTADSDEILRLEKLEESERNKSKDNGDNGRIEVSPSVEPIEALLAEQLAQNGDNESKDGGNDVLEVLQSSECDESLNMDKFDNCFDDESKEGRNGTIESDESLRAEKFEKEDDNELKNGGNDVTEISQSAEPEESIRTEKSEESVDNEPKDEQNAGETRNEAAAFGNEDIINVHDSTGGQQSAEKHPIITKTWCKNNNPMLVDEEDEDARLMGRVRTRHIVCTGSVSRTAKMFEKEEEINSLSQKQQNPSIRPTSTVPEARPQNERIRKAFAFWNQ